MTVKHSVSFLYIPDTQLKHQIHAAANAKNNMMAVWCHFLMCEKLNFKRCCCFLICHWTSLPHLHGSSNAVETQTGMCKLDP